MGLKGQWLARSLSNGFGLKDSVGRIVSGIANLPVRLFSSPITLQFRPTVPSRTPSLSVSVEFMGSIGNGNRIIPDAIHVYIK